MGPNRAFNRPGSAQRIWTAAETLCVTTTISPPPSLFRTTAVPAELRVATVRQSAVAQQLVAHHTAPSVDPTAPDASATVETQIAAGDVLENGDHGVAVRDLQRRLDRLGYGVAIDGQFGPSTTATVQRFQGDSSVATTGRVGPTTLMALRVAEARSVDIAIAPLFQSVGPGRVLDVGARGIEVQTLQRLLTLAGHPVSDDGVFGPTTRTAVQDFQRAMRVAPTGQFGRTTMQVLNTRIDALGVDVVAQLGLPAGYGSLEKLAGQLVAMDVRYSPTTGQGRSTLAMALAIGGTEVYGQHTSGTDFFTRRGGTGNNMLGFAQFNLDFHAAEINTPQRYAGYLADILNGVERMPNSDPASDQARALSAAIGNGTIRNGGDLRVFLDQRGFGGSNWQGIDDGWSRNPGLADALVRFLLAPTPPVTPVFT